MFDTNIIYTYIFKLKIKNLIENQKSMYNWIILLGYVQKTWLDNIFLLKKVQNTLQVRKKYKFQIL